MNWNLFFMGVSIGTAIMCFASGNPTLGLINTFAAALNAIVVFS